MIKGESFLSPIVSLMQGENRRFMVQRQKNQWHSRQHEVYVYTRGPVHEFMHRWDPLGGRRLSQGRDHGRLAGRLRGGTIGGWLAAPPPQSGDNQGGWLVTGG